AGITAIAFMSILYFFNVWLGKVGSFLMLIFMVVQLAGSAGTYPIEISGDFVATIHKWLPFSYAVDAFRGTISGNGNILEVTIVLLSIAIIFTLLTIMMFNIRAKMIKNNKKGLYDFIEKCGLA
ncbi:YhgE/Pip family protein, partial [Klebsiella pneumoniae]|uniref:YhgE/Pip family protein n=2 Tax=Bacteria TaxID=2 RepID=UPI0025A1F3CB